MNVKLFKIRLISFLDIMWNFIKRDFKTRYLGSHFGMFWAFAQPIITILVYWFVFQVGFKTADIGDTPYALWLIAGIIPWFLYSESLGTATGAILENSYLVNKISFNALYLPVTKILSAGIIHLFFIILLFFISLYSGVSFDIYSVQVIYYFIALCIHLIGLTWLTSSIIVFFKDLGQIINIIIQFGFWLTPIFWYNGILDPEIEMYFRFNPIYYITEGYRNTFIYHKWFWESPTQTFYFWSMTLFFVFLGYTVFQKLKPHFSDVL